MGYFYNAILSLIFALLTSLIFVFFIKVYIPLIRKQTYLECLIEIEDIKKEKGISKGEENLDQIFRISKQSISSLINQFSIHKVGVNSLCFIHIVAFSVYFYALSHYPVSLKLLFWMVSFSYFLILAVQDFKTTWLTHSQGFFAILLGMSGYLLDYSFVTYDHHTLLQVLFWTGVVLFALQFSPIGTGDLLLIMALCFYVDIIHVVNGIAIGVFLSFPFSLYSKYIKQIEYISFGDKILVGTIISFFFPILFTSETILDSIHQLF